MLIIMTIVLIRDIVVRMLLNADRTLDDNDNNDNNDDDDFRNDDKTVP
jgi:hypothetical protein